MYARAYLICINWDAVNYHLSGLTPLFNFKKRSNMHYNIWVHFIFIWVNILLYFTSFALWETENKGAWGHLRGSEEFPTKTWVLQYLIVQPFLPISIFIFFANNQVILTQIQHKQLFINSHLRQLKFTIKWQYKFLNYNSYNLTINISLKYKK